MPSQIHNLDRESLLLLYAADELSVHDRQRVDAMLNVDAAMRAQLDELVAMQDSMAATFAQADATRPLPAPASSSVRHVGMAIRQWQVDRFAKPTQNGIRHRRKLGWLYGSAAVAAAAVITIFVLWSRVDDGRQPWDEHGQSTAVQPDGSQAQDVADATPVHVTPDPDDYTPEGGGDADRQLSSAEHELATLNTLTDSVRPTEETVTP